MIPNKINSKVLENFDDKAKINATKKMITDNDPHVKIISPALVKMPPHYYQNTGTLCLYSSENFKWTKEKLIAQNIVSWTAAWIYFYEVWLQKGIWYGPEAQHTQTKTQT